MSPLGSVATEPFNERSDLCPLLPQERPFEGLNLEGRQGPMGDIDLSSR
jgi:hypothetical protein